ncbi:4-hydroxybenzoyl-CoA thioesterase family active site [plant metagenome]|uniref:4-hydroxybenzoyl-CoA thioesterase family active site n=2 Tax=plant metagenome TaxID=1297885 RepID=A0A484RHZ4_9ZZZZ
MKGQDMETDTALAGQQRPDAGITHRVCYADTDAGGYVYHARYIEFAEHARNQLMYAAGYSFASLASAHGVMLVVHRVEAQHHLPARLEDSLSLRARIAWCRPSKSRWVTEARRGDALLATITIDMVALNVRTRELARHPEPFLAALLDVGQAQA